MTSTERKRLYPIIGVRCTQDEYNRLKMHAHFNGKTAQKILKDAFFRSVNTQLPIGRVDARKLELQLSAIGNGVNSLITTVSEHPDQTMRSEMVRLVDAILALKTQLGELYGNR